MQSLELAIYASMCLSGLNHEKCTVVRGRLHYRCLQLILVAKFLSLASLRFRFTY